MKFTNSNTKQELSATEELLSLEREWNTWLATIYSDAKGEIAAYASHFDKIMWILIFYQITN